ncbi:MAG TPA: MOSC domain-containing protein [Candidatus Dormibacteraeota bacterium]
MPARIVSIQLCQGHRQPMKLVSSATLITGLGIEGDKHAVATSDRQVLLADQEALDEVGVEPGTIKENLTVQGLHVMGLPVGSRVRLGESAVLEITNVCEPCFRMDEIRMGLKAELVGRRGMVARVITGGSIAVGDRIELEEAEPLAS